MDKTIYCVLSPNGFVRHPNGRVRSFDWNDAYDFVDHRADFKIEPIARHFPLLAL